MLLPSQNTWPALFVESYDDFCLAVSVTNFCLTFGIRALIISCKGAVCVYLKPETLGSFTWNDRRNIMLKE